MHLCKFCSRVFEKERSRHSHSIRCSLNPRKVPGANQWTKGKYVLKDETRQKFSKLAKGRTVSENVKQRLRAVAFKRGFGGVTQSRRIYYKGKILGSTYEYQVVISLEENQVKWDTCKAFNYIDSNGIKRRYTPDIFLPDFNVFLDPKNDFLIVRDEDKIRRVCEQNNILVLILSKDNLDWSSIKKLL